MKIGFVVNDIRTEFPGYTTTHLALEANNRGHEVWYIDVAAFACESTDSLSAKARAAPRRKYRRPTTFLAALQGKEAETTCDLRYWTHPGSRSQEYLCAIYFPAANSSAERPLPSWPVVTTRDIANPETCSLHFWGRAMMATTSRTKPFETAPWPCWPNDRCQWGCQPASLKIHARRLAMSAKRWPATQAKRCG